MVSVIASAVAVSSLGVAVHAVNVASATRDALAATTTAPAYSPLPSAAILDTPAEVTRPEPTWTPRPPTKKECREWARAWGVAAETAMFAKPGCETVKLKVKQPRTAPVWHGPTPSDLALADHQRWLLELRVQELERDAKAAQWSGSLSPR